MKQRNQKWHTWETAGLFAVILLGNTLHFVYDWTGQARWAAFISAVNESTWEHMKLLFVPWFLWTIAECIGLRSLRRSADEVDRRTVQIAVQRLAGRTEEAPHQQLKHRVAAVRKTKRADLVDRAPVHVQMKIVFQANASIVRNFLYYTTSAGRFSSGRKKMVDLLVTFCYN